jgi:hypothetical protein
LVGVHSVGEAPQTLWTDVRAIDQEIQMLGAEIERLSIELCSWTNQTPEVQRFRTGLAGLFDNFKKIPTNQQSKLLRSVIDSLHADQDGGVCISLLEKAEAWQNAMRKSPKSKKAQQNSLS